MDSKGILGILAGLVFVGFAVLILVFLPQPDISISVAESFNQALWDFRTLDVLLQLFIILAGAFGVITLVKEKIL